MEIKIRSKSLFPGLEGWKEIISEVQRTYLASKSLFAQILSGHD